MFLLLFTREKDFVLLILTPPIQQHFQQLVFLPSRLEALLGKLKLVSLIKDDWRF